MQNRHHTNPTADVTGIGRQLDDRISGGFDEQTVDVLLMQARKSPELMRQRKDHMIIRYRQEFLLPPLEPCLDVALVAFRATAVTTGVIRILQPAAVITFKYMAPHGGRTASEYVLERTSMTGQHSFDELLQIIGTVASEDVCHFDHGGSCSFVRDDHSSYPPSGHLRRSIRQKTSGATDKIKAHALQIDQRRDYREAVSPIRKK